MPCAAAPVRSWFALVLALPVALFVSPVVAVPDVFAPVRRPRVVAALPAAVVEGTHGVACAPVCAPGDVVVPEVVFVPWLDRVDGDDVDGDDVLPVLPYCASAGTASARLSATPPANVIDLLLT